MKNIITVVLLALLSWHGAVLAVVSSNVNLEIDAESVARVALYYKDQPVTSRGIDFPMPINGISQRLERVSDFLYLVGNIEEASIVFSDVQFILYSQSGRSEKMNLSGYFIQQGTSSSAQAPLGVPVLKNISDATVATGFKVHFISEFTSGVYTQDVYANVFTLLVTPKI